MINTSIGKIPEHWRDITLETAMRVSAIELPDVDDLFTWFEHMPKVVEILSAITGTSKAEIEKVRPEQLVYMFTKNVLPFVQDLHSDAPQSYQPKLIDMFRHNGVTYFMPESLPIAGDVVLSHGQNPKAFVEASNLLALYSKMRKSGIQVMPMFVASVVKEQPGEDFDESVIAKRAEQMRTLPMDLFWEVFFCTSALTLRHMSATLRSMLGVEKPKPKLGSKEYRDMRLGQLAQHKAALRAAWKRLIA